MEVSWYVKDQGKHDGSRQRSGSIQVGTVDHMDGEKYIKLNKRDSPDGQHRWVPVDWVESVNDNAVPQQDSGRV